MVVSLSVNYTLTLVCVNNSKKCSWINFIRRNSFFFSKCNISVIPSAGKQKAVVNLHRCCHLTILHNDL